MILDIFRVTVTKSLESVEDFAAYDEYQNRHAVDLVLDYMIRNGAVIEVSLPNGSHATIAPVRELEVFDP